MASYVAVIYSLFCDCGFWIGQEQSRRELYALAIRHGWKRVRMRGWTCPACQKG